MEDRARGVGSLRCVGRNNRIPTGRSKGEDDVEVLDMKSVNNPSTTYFVQDHVQIPRPFSPQFVSMHSCDIFQISSTLCPPLTTGETYRNALLELR